MRVIRGLNLGDYNRLRLQLCWSEFPKAYLRERIRPEGGRKPEHGGGEWMFMQRRFCTRPRPHDLWPSTVHNCRRTCLRQKLRTSPFVTEPQVHGGTVPWYLYVSSAERPHPSPFSPPRCGSFDHGQNSSPNFWRAPPHPLEPRPRKGRAFPRAVALGLPLWGS